MSARTVRVLTVWLTALAVLPASAGAASDGAATQAYVQANYTLVNTAASKIPRGEATLQNLLAQVRRECPQAATQSPQNPESTQLSDEVIGAMVTAAIRPILPNIRAYLQVASRQRWSSGSLTRAVKIYTGQLRAMAGLAQPHLCADVRAWAGSGYKTLPASTVAFDRVFVPNWVAVGELPGGLGRFESGAVASLARRSGARETQLTDFEAREVETWGHIMDALELNP
jgi:hypothetical protein